MQFPRIHLNGSDATTLQTQYCDAILAVQDAIAAVRKIDCNNRDYYTISAGAGNVAMEEHRARLASLETIRSDLESIAINIDEQRPA